MSQTFNQVECGANWFCLFGKHAIENIFLSDLYSNDKCTEKLKFIFISFVLWVDRGACHHIRGGETGGVLEEADSQMFLWKSQAQDMGQLKFTMHWLM